MNSLIVLLNNCSASHRCQVNDGVQQGKEKARPSLKCINIPAATAEAVHRIDKLGMGMGRLFLETIHRCQIGHLQSDKRRK